jgi:hypothetical protein
MTTMGWPLDCGTTTFDALDPATWTTLPQGYTWEERGVAGQFHLISPDGTDVSLSFRLYRAVFPERTDVTALLVLPANCREALGMFPEDELDDGRTPLSEHDDQADEEFDGYELEFEPDWP